MRDRGAGGDDDIHFFHNRGGIPERLDPLIGAYDMRRRRRDLRFARPFLQTKELSPGQVEQGLEKIDLGGARLVVAEVGIAAPRETNLQRLGTQTGQFHIRPRRHL